MPRLHQFDFKKLTGHAGIVGVDEAGRGSLAGPVVAAAVWLQEPFYADSKLKRACRAINDSKQVPHDLRVELLAQMEGWRQAGRLCFAWAAASVEEIAVLNILGATRLAMQRSLEQLIRDHACPLRPNGEALPLFELPESLQPPSARLLVDGKPLRPFPYRHEALVGGDGRSLAIAMASIVAKVNRDRLMAELDPTFPAYAFAVNKGYGTPAHRQALLEHGPCSAHRVLFLRKLLEATDEDADDQAELWAETLVETLNTPAAPAAPSPAHADSPGNGASVTPISGC